jgi:hypothetical protein
VILGIVALAGFASCSVSKSSVTHSTKYSLGQLEKDYTLYREVLETHHPGLYWYTPKDSMDLYFEEGKAQLKDSMNEPEFRKILSYVTARIKCGHTSVKSSKAWARYSDTVRLAKMFPLSMKVWDEAMVVTQSLIRRDSHFRRGTQILSINNRPWPRIVDTLFQYISTDGYNTTHKFQALSNRGFFGALYTSVFGLSNSYRIEYIDTMGRARTIQVPPYDPGRDTVRRPFTRPGRPTVTPPQPSKRERRRQQRDQVRLLKIDTLNRTAMMDLASFGRGYGLRRFFRMSFRTLKENQIGHLVIDVRGNGGGSVNNSTLITRYLADRRFKFADSLYSIRKSSPYQKYIDDHFWNKLFMTLLTSKKRDGKYHFGYFERHYFRPKKRNHFNGKSYILIGGNSFSATTLFASALKSQENVVIVGEETGGGAYGNSAWLIPDVTLPETGVRFRLPLFRLVIDKNIPRNGHGVIPEVFSGPTIEAVRTGADYKLDRALQLIMEDKQKEKL